MTLPHLSCDVIFVKSLKSKKLDDPIVILEDWRDTQCQMSVVLHRDIFQTYIKNYFAYHKEKGNTNHLFYFSL